MFKNGKHHPEHVETALGVMFFNFPTDQYSLRKMHYKTDVYSCFQVHGTDKSIDTGFYPPSPQDKIGLVYIKLKEIT